MARKEKRYHYIYKTTCKITNNFYVGMHSTDNLEDGYMGSGKRLRHSIRKHGIENHACEILEFLPDRSSLKSREAEIVNEQFLQDQLCMNLQLGGGGGFSSKEHYNKFVKSCKNNGQIHKKLLEEDKNYKQKFILRIRDSRKKQSFKGDKNGFYNKQHSEETKQKLSEKSSQRIGEKNSQYGTCWITNGSDNKKIKKTETLPDGWKLGRTTKN